MDRVSVAETAEKLGTTRLFIQYALQQGKLPFGVAVKFKKRYVYYINRKQLEEYLREKEGA